MPLPIYPDTPRPRRVTSRVVTRPVIEQEFDSVYRQARALTNRNLRGWTLEYDHLSVADRDVIQTFFDAVRGPAGRFDYLVHQDLAVDPGFEQAADTAYAIGQNQAANPGFESGAIDWTSLVSELVIVSDPSNARTGSYVARKLASATQADQLDNAVVFDVRPGELIYVEAWVKSSGDANGDARVRVQWIGEAGTAAPVGEGTATGLVGPQTTYARNAAFVRAPATAIAARASLVVEDHTTGTWWVDDVFVRRFDRAWFQDTPYLWAFPLVVAGQRTGGEGALVARIPSAIGATHVLRGNQRIAVVPGERLLLSGWMRASGAGAKATILASYYNVAGTFIGTGFAENTALTVPAFWRRYFSVLTVPTGAATVELSVQTDDTSTAAVDVDFDDVSLRQFAPCRFAADRIVWAYEGMKRWAASVELVEAP